MSTSEPESLDDILQACKPSLQSVLSTAAFVQAVKTGHQKLNDFLLSEEIFPTILDIALTNKAQEMGYSSRAISNVMLFLTTNTKETQQKFSESPLFLNVIQNFPNTQYAKINKIAGNFQRILDSIVHRTNGHYLANLPDLATFLIDNINIYAYSELWVTLTTEFMNQFGVDLNLILRFTNTVKGSNALNAASAMKQMLKLKKDLFHLFETEEVLKIILDEAIKPGNPLLAFKLFQVLERINSIGKDENAKTIIQSYAEKFDFDSHKTDYIKACAISLFKYFPDEYINLLFEENSLSQLCAAISKALPFLTIKKLIELNRDFSLIDRIMNCKISKTNPYVWTLAEALYQIPSLNTPAWKEFHNDIIDPHVRIRNGAYGGERPREESSDYQDNIEYSTPFVSLDMEELSDSSSSDTSSDEENDKGGFENARFFAKLAGMDDLVELLNDQQKSSQNV